MSQSATTARILLLFALVSSFVSAQNVSAQNSSSASLSWRRMGEPSINRHLAGAASGPVSAVWYSADHRFLIVQTSSGKMFQTADSENWTATVAAPAAISRTVSPVRTPEAGALTIAVPDDSRRIWSLGGNLSVSDDFGATWTNVTASGGQSVIGSGQTGVAVDPLDPTTYSVANGEGIWQTHDGGRSWTGLNDRLPNLPIARILSTTRGNVRVSLNDGRALRLSNPRFPWEESEEPGPDASNAEDRRRVGSQLGAEITVLTRSGDWAYAGSIDGRLWASLDQGGTWGAPQSAGRGAVVSIFISPDAPRAALAAIAGPGPHLVRTIDAGAVWDDVSGNLSDVAVNAAAADPASGTAFAATDRGIYMARVDLNAFSPAGGWTAVNGVLPHARAVDVALDSTGRQVFAALEGYGLYAAPVALRSGAWRVANAADFSNRPAAPGSVISILGGQVTAAKSGDLSFPVLAAREDESELQVPFEASGNSLSGTIQSLAIQSKTGPASISLAVRPVSPAIFIDRDGFPFLVDADTGLALDPSVPVHPQSRLQMMVTGLGRVQPPWPSGVPAPAENTPAVVANVQAFLNGQPLEVTRAALAPGYIGYYLVEVELPAALDTGAAQLSLVVDGQPSNRVSVLVTAE